jgi:hypothetical protein
VFDILRALVYNARMGEHYAQFRIWQTTLKKLRRIYAETGESMIAIVDRLAEQELQRLKDADSQDVQVQVVSQQEERPPARTD